MIFQGFSAANKCINKVIIIMNSPDAEDDESKVQKIILELNKVGLSYLKFLGFQQAIEYFKKAEKIVTEQLIISQDNLKINQLAAITYNNIACYYKKTKKPKVALGYLKKSLQIQIYKLNDWISIASTHLNLCAIYSYLKKHDEGLGHVELALQLLEKQKFQPEDSSEEGKVYWNIKMLCLYNKAIEEEHLREFAKSLDSYKQTKQLAKVYGAKNVGIIMSCDDAIGRMQADFANRKKRMISAFLKKKQDEQSGHYDFMRRNINRQKNSNLNIRDFSSAQLVKQARNAKIHLTGTTANKQALASLYRSKNISLHMNSRRDHYRSNTEQADPNFS